VDFERANRACSGRCECALLDGREQSSIGRSEVVMANVYSIVAGRLVEVRIDAAVLTAADVDTWFNGVAAAMSRLPAGQRGVVVADWRRCPLMSDDSSESLRRAKRRPRQQRLPHHRPPIPPPLPRHEPLGQPPPLHERARTQSVAQRTPHAPRNQPPQRVSRGARASHDRLPLSGGRGRPALRWTRFRQRRRQRGYRANDTFISGSAPPARPPLPSSKRPSRLPSPEPPPRSTVCANGGSSDPR
jgi:hypothetical protein